jgi:hypothetical protein
MQGFGDAAGARLFAGLPPVDLRQEHRHHALEQLRVAPEDVEGLVEDLELLAPAEEDARQGPVEVVAPLDPRDLERAHRVEHPVRADRQSRRAQHAREVHHVFGEAALCHRNADGNSWMSSSPASCGRF